ncbi:hypothetical protein VM1G_08683 [Cytospora mali]|uniref:DUF7924 domain-containing protein n=1 Tax=Cytospora mali TaxID=578113 RepID=A0A194WAD8_CYTMA|nr:hypothetical protein VM1G_08683 [Valsa mali]
MAYTRAQSAAQTGRPLPAPKDQGVRSHKKQFKDTQSRRDSHPRRGRLQEQPTISKTLSQDPPAQSRGCKRKESVEDTPNSSPEPNHKRQRPSPARCAEVVSGASAIDNSAPKLTDPISYWVEEGRWPEEQCWLETESTMEGLLARKKSPSNLSRKRSNSATSITPSDQRPREEKSNQYRNPQYALLLQTKGSYMGKSPLGITDESKRLCETLLYSGQPTPNESLFDDDIFESVCDNLANRNEARVIQDVSRLIVPSAEQYALRRKHLKHLVESINEGWNNSIPLTGTRPQPDYSVGFRREAFTEDQLTKLSPFIGDFLFGDQSFFMATYYMYFPFLTCEVKCGSAALDIADRQNAHSMTLAVRAVAELFRTVKREDEVNRQILAFSISHDYRSVRIYGHYPVINGKDIKYYCHPIHDFSFSALNGKDRWTAHRFTKNIYDKWLPAHFEKISSAVDQLPSNLDFDVPPLPEATELSQDLGNLMQSGVGSVPVGQDSQSSNAVQQGLNTSDTSFTRPGVVKKRKGEIEQ